MSLERLMLRREHFPILVNTINGNRRIPILPVPPYHPSMHANGIDLDIAESVLELALQETLADLQESAQKDAGVYELEQFKEELGMEREPVRDANRLVVPIFPLLKSLYVGRRIVTPYLGSHSYIEMPGSIEIPAEYIFYIKQNLLTPELLKEYSASKIGTSNGIASVNFPFGWLWHNVDDADIFFKNFVIAMDNEFVRRKYSRA